MIAREVFQLTEDGASLICISARTLIAEALRISGKKQIFSTEKAKVPLLAKGARRE